MTIQGEVVAHTGVRETLDRVRKYFERPEASLFILVVVKSKEDATAVQGVAPYRLEVRVLS